MTAARKPSAIFAATGREEDHADQLGDDRLNRALEQLQGLPRHGHLLTPRLFGVEQSAAGTDEIFVVRPDEGR